MTVKPTDIEAHVRSTLLALGDPVVTKVPNPRPSRFIRVSAAGGGRANLVQSRPFVIVECWAADTVAASDLASDAWGRIETAYGPDVPMTMPTDFPDPESGQARYQFTAQPVIDLEES